MKILRSSQGLTLFMVIFVMTFFLLFVTGGLIFSGMELKKSNNLKLEVQAIEMADAGLQHALAAIPWIWDFNAQLGCGSPPCTLVSSASLPSVPGFTYTVTAANDPADGGGTTSDTNTTIVLTSKSSGPSSTSKSVVAYIRRSLVAFAPPGALYVNAASASPQVDSSSSTATGFFDLNDNTLIIGNDTNTNNTAGPKASVWGVAATSSTVTNALTTEYTGTYSSGFTGMQLHDVCHGCNYLGVEVAPGAKVEPSISTVSDVLDVDTIAANFFGQATTVKYFNGLVTDSTTCPSSTPCQFGTSAAPQITYIKEANDTDITLLRGYITGYGVLVLEGRPTIGENFQFYGLIIHKRANGSAFISIEDSAKVYGGVLLGSYDEGDGNGKKARFGIKDTVRLYYSSQALAAVDSNWGSLLPKPPRVFAWLDK